MGSTAHDFVQRVMSGDARGKTASLLRSLLRTAEPAYAGLMRLRNALYARGIKRVVRLGRPVISVGNITAGGTGKTPVVAWLADRLREAGIVPAVLMRGYKAAAGQQGDEQAMLADLLGRPGEAPVVVHANRNRVAGAAEVLKDHPEVGAFVLDDGFQHRRAHRDIDLVLIDATRPFGFGHVHPRGLLREPLGGLARADAVVLTRCDLVAPDALATTEATVRRYNPGVPLFRARHALAGLRTPDGRDLTLADLAGLRFFAFAGIANPAPLERQLHALPGEFVGGSWFADHHAYGADDLAEMRRIARDRGANVILVTEKDWAKLRRLPGAAEGDPPLRRLSLRIEFEGDGEQRLAELILRGIDR